MPPPPPFQNPAYATVLPQYQAESGIWQQHRCQNQSEIKATGYNGSRHLHLPAQLERGLKKVNLR